MKQLHPPASPYIPTHPPAPPAPRISRWSALSSQPLKHEVQDQFNASEEWLESSDLSSNNLPTSICSSLGPPDTSSAAEKSPDPEEAVADTELAVHTAEAELAVHTGIWCDVCGTKPIQGERYMQQLPHDTFDVCQGCYQQLDDEKKAELHKVAPIEPTPEQPEDRWSNPETYYTDCAYRHENVICDASGMRPIVGARYQKVGQDYDLCEAEFAKLTATEKGTFQCIAYPGATPVRMAEAMLEAAQDAKEVPAPTKQAGSTVNIEVGPIWGSEHVSEVVAQYLLAHEGHTWTGQWCTTVPGVMSVIQIHMPEADAVKGQHPWRYPGCPNKPEITTEGLDCPSMDVELEVGASVLYRGSTPTTVLAVHRDDVEPFYTIRVGDSERQTTIKHLTLQPATELPLNAMAAEEPARQPSVEMTSSWSSNNADEEPATEALASAENIAIMGVLGLYTSDLSASTIADISAACEAQSMPLHPGIWCDILGMRPITGARYHKVGQDYDVCEAEFVKLTATEKAAFEKIEHPGAVPVRMDAELKAEAAAEALAAAEAEAQAAAAKAEAKAQAAAETEAEACAAEAQAAEAEAAAGGDSHVSRVLSCYRRTLVM